MFKKIYVPVDNSEYSNRAVDFAVMLGRAFGAHLTGCHVYAARLHDYRFKQMEYTLPEEYKDENELERQRKIHDSLIAMGLQLISDSYLDVMGKRAEEAGLFFERRMMDGKHYKALIEDIRAGEYDLVILGALGIGAVKDSQLGSVTERLVRRITTDTIVVRSIDPLEQQHGAIVVGLDGSPQSFNGLKIGIALAKALGRPLHAVAVYDPYLHYSMFNGIVGVLSEKASKIFRFKEQEQLHEEIIDTGLAKIYQSHLEIGRKLAVEDGVDLAITLLDGKCFEKILQFCRKEHPWLLILGRVGVHSDENEMDLGSNTENLLRLAPCNVLLTGGRFYPPLD
ncbi:MAG: universal stress protein, partial [Candidatus Rokubacteria bacterium]|nr:universal stress protein [Candidatus Rokubacteria bacterium]